MKERILIIEDDDEIVNILERWLVLDGYRIDSAQDGIAGTGKALEQDFDLIILDLMLPGRDGMDVCRDIREQKDTPILMLTARDTVPDRVQGLDSGADDYLTKPFDPHELMARIRALLRRTSRDKTDVYQFEDLILDTGTHLAHRGQRVIELTAKEYELLELLMQNPRQVLARSVIYDRVWGYDFGGDSNIIEVYIRYLRQKIEEAGETRLIHTVRGVGYVLREDI
ncbi:MAG: response regulator transcription factor [Anaerolineales bacterium]|nr:response regulator transcription factor [Anaerolineales bacterium]